MTDAVGRLDGLIRSSTLLFDRRRWPEVIGELQARAEAPSRPAPV